MNLKSNPFTAGLLALALTGSAPAAVTLYAEYHLGEAGSLAATTLNPQDSSGNGRNFTNSLGTATTGSTDFHANAVGSTAYVNTSGGGNEGWYGANFSSLQTDNFAFGVFASASSLSDAGDVFSLGGNSPSGAYKLSLTANGWQASSVNNGFFAGTGTLVADQWVHLAIIRINGLATFYVNGVAMGGAATWVPANNTGHIAVSPGGGAFFDGRIDEARIVTFDNTESTANILNSLQGVPEPSVALLGGLSALMLLRRRRM